MQERVPYAVSPPRYSVSHQMVTTAFELPNYRVVQTLVGGNITVFTKLCEQTRSDAFDIMIQHATEVGANAVIGARYDTTEIGQGVTEVLAYGTAVIVEPANPGESFRS
jgi:uncharacterized protein YbjQ (UPF0145 family)